MKKKGRLVIEAAYLVPFICILMVYLFFFTLYTHDYAVVVHAALESGVKGLYEENLSDRQIEKKIKEDLEAKLSERLLWAKEYKVETEVSPVKAKVRITWEGSFLPLGELEFEKNLYRIKPCEILRYGRWLAEKGE